MRKKVSQRAEVINMIPRSTQYTTPKTARRVATSTPVWMSKGMIGLAVHPVPQARAAPAG
jgi:hypothetical protein